MFSSIESLLQKSNASEVHYVWVKLFVSTQSMPKDFFTIFPQFQDISQLFNFTPYETKTVKMVVQSSKDRKQLNDKLVQLFSLNSPIDDKFLEIFRRISNLKSTRQSEASIRFLFKAALRIFAKIVNQFPQDLRDILEKKTEMPNYLVDLHKILFFFSCFQDSKNFEEFYPILLLFMSDLSFRFEDLLRPTLSVDVQEACLNILNGLVSCNRVYLSLNPGTESKIIAFIIQQFDKIFVIMDGSNMTKPIAISICGILASLIPDAPLIQQSQSRILGAVSLSLISAIIKSESCGSTEIYRMSTICLKLYSGTCGEEQETIPKYQFTSMVVFINWLIQNCKDVILDDKMEPTPPFDEPDSLPDFVNVSEYLTNEKMIMDSKEFVLSERLNNVAVLILSICEHFRDISPFIANLFETIKIEDGSTPEQNRTFVAFVMTLISKIPMKVINSALENNWSLLLSTLIFPADISEPSDVRLKDLVLDIVLRAFSNAPESRRPILIALNKYFDQYKNSAIVYFLKLLNSMLYVGKIDFMQILIQTSITSTLWRAATDSFLVFDFMRALVHGNPSTFLTKIESVNFIFDNIEREQFRSSLLSFLDAGFSITDTQSLITLFKLVAKRFDSLTTETSMIVIKKALSHPENWSDDFISSNALRIFMDSISLAKNEEYVLLLINECMKLSKFSPELFLFISQPDLTLYKNLKKVTNPICSKEINDALLEFTFTSPQSNNELKTIKNFRALEILCKWNRGTESESQILNQLWDLASYSSTNIYQMNQASIPRYILERMEAMNNDLETANHFLDLFVKLAQNSFTTSILYQCIKIMKSRTFMYPNLIMNMFFNLVTNEKTVGPPCFFHFDGTGTGIFGPQYALPEQFSIVTCLRAESTASLLSCPVFSFDSGKSEYLTVTLTKKILKISWISSGQLKNINCNTQIEDNEWVSIAAVFSQKGLVIYINGKLDTTIPDVILSKSTYNITIAALNNSMKATEIPCDMGPVYFIKSTDVSQVKMELTPDGVKKLFEKNCFICYSPRATQEGKILNIASSVVSVDFRGKAIPFNNTIMDIFKSVSVLPNLLPIIQRLSYCEHCRCKHNEPCQYCNSLSYKVGNEMLVSLLQIIVMCFNESQTLQIAFEDINGYNLLSSFLLQANPYYIDIQVMNAIADMYACSSDPDFASQAIENIFYNFDFITQLSPELQEKVYKIVIYRLYQTNPRPFTASQSFDSILYKTVDASNKGLLIAPLVWSFLKKVFTVCAQNDLYIRLLNILGNCANDAITLQIIDILDTHYSENEEGMITVLKAFNFFIPFVLAMTETKSSSIQCEILKTISKISKKTNREDFEKFVTIISLYYQETDNNERVIKTLLKLIVVDGKLENIELFPLFVCILKKLNKEESLEFYKAFEEAVLNQETTLVLTRITNWEYWLLELCIHVFDPIKETDRISKIFSAVLFQVLKEGHEEVFEEVMRYFEVNSLEKKIDSSKLIKNILKELIKRENIVNGPLSSKASSIFKEVFKLLFLHITTNQSNSEPAGNKHYGELIKIDEDKYSRLEFCPMINENGEWEDIDIVETILAYVDQIPAFSFRIFKSSINVMVMFAYILVTLYHFNEKLFIDTVPKFVARLKSASYDEAYIASSMLYLIIRRKKLEVPEKEQLIYYVHNYNDDADSPDLQLFLFEDWFISMSTDNLQFIINGHKDLISSMSERFEKMLGFDISRITPASDTSSVKEALKISSTIEYQSFSLMYSKFISRQKSVLDTERVLSKKSIASFMHGLSSGGGPWAEKKVDNHFMFSSKISAKGKHVLSSINQSFDLHKEASEKRDKKEVTTIETEEETDSSKKSNCIIKPDDFHVEAKRISLKNTFYGELAFGGKSLVFDGKRGSNLKHISIKLHTILYVLSRKFDAEEFACEVFTTFNKSYYFTFKSLNERSKFYKMLNTKCPVKKDSDYKEEFNLFNELRKVTGFVCQMQPSSELIEKIGLTKLWTTRAITTYEYLYYLNILSGRSFNDASQYPIYPWVLKVYDSPQISLTNPNVYRDFSVPIGKSFCSTKKSVSNFLIRTEPFTSIHIEMNEKRFAEKVFQNIQDEWNKATHDDGYSYELTPEFFSTPMFLLNENKFDLGDGVDDVVLPKWAHSPWYFIVQNKAALESDYTSKNIGKWIDLIFGVNRGTFTFAKSKALIATEGLLPEQLFTSPHPSRNARNPINHIPDIHLENDIVGIRKRLVLLANDTLLDFRKDFNLQPKKLPGDFGNIMCAAKRKSICVFHEGCDYFVTAVELENSKFKTISHSAGNIKAAAIIGSRYLITGGADCSLQIRVLPSFSIARISMLHSDPIVAVDGCNETDVIASIDKQGLLILESLHTGKFICSTEQKIDSSTPILSVFKSSVVVLVVPNITTTEIIAFDSKLSVIAKLSLRGMVTEFCKIEDSTGEEFCAIALESTIYILESYSLDVIVSFSIESDSPHLCSLGKERTIMCGYGKEIKFLSF